MQYVALVRQQLMTLIRPGPHSMRRMPHVTLTVCGGWTSALSLAVATIPLPQRRLLTYHDSWPYFARRYGMTVIGDTTGEFLRALTT